MNELEGFPRRLRKWRDEELGVSMDRMLRAVNEHLPEDLQVRSKGSVHNWETTRWGNTSKKAKRGPGSEFLVALKLTYPDLNLDWLLFGHGEPRVSDQEAKEFHERLASLPEPSTDMLIPSTWLRRHLPQSAKEALVSFFREVRNSHVAYYAEETGPSFEELPEGTEEAPIPWEEAVAAGDRRIDEVRKRVCELLEAPFEGGEAWACVEELSDAELTSYVQAQLSSWRPLIRSMRSG